MQLTTDSNTIQKSDDLVQSHLLDDTNRSSLVKPKLVKRFDFDPNAKDPIEEKINTEKNIKLKTERESMKARSEYLKSSMTALPLEKQDQLNSSLDISRSNKSVIAKLIHEQEEEYQREVKNLKWKKHKDYLEKQYDKIQKFREQKEDERVNKQKIEAEQRLLQLSTIQPKGQAFLNSKRQELRLYKSEFVPTEKPQSPKVQIKERTEKVKEMIKSKSEIIQLQRKKDKNQPNKEKQKHQKQIEKAKQMAEHYDQVKEMKIEFTQKFQSLYSDNALQAQFKYFRKTGSQAFNHFLKFSEPYQQMGKEIQLQGWIKFCETFSLNLVLKIEQISKIFRSTLKQKNRVLLQEAIAQNIVYHDSNGLTYYEFEYMLLKCAILGQQYFNSILSGKDYKKNQEELLKYREKLNQEQIKLHQYQEEMNKNISSTTVKTIEAMLAYLDIPQNKELFAGRLRSKKPEDIKEGTVPRYQPLDTDTIKKEMALPEIPQVKTKQWKMPGQHSKPDKIKEREEKKVKELEQLKERMKQRSPDLQMPFSYVKANQKQKSMLEKYANQDG